jgi:hypothetical protein
MLLFTNSHGRVQYDNLQDDYKYEFEYGSSPFWNIAPSWIYIAEIRVLEKFKQHGITLLKEFISSLPINTGIVRA